MMAAIQEETVQHGRGTFYLRRVPDDLRSSPPSLTLVWGFFGATESAIAKYSSIHHRRGSDVLFIPSQFQHFAWPKSSVKLAVNLLNFLSHQCQHYDVFIIHAFSMGTYNFTVFQKTMLTSGSYLDVERKLRAVIFDSIPLGSLQIMCRGVARGITQKGFLKSLIYNAVMSYFYSTYWYTIKLHNFYIDVARHKPLKRPTLVFMCKNDLVADWQYVTGVTKTWEFPVQIKCWDKSRHVAHFLIHTEEYEEILNTFLEEHVAREETVSSLKAKL